MFVLVLTGGIAMGKSTGLAALRALAPDWRVFDADASVRRLLTEPRIARKIAAEFGEPALDRDGSVNRPFLREQVFDSAQRRAALENILHPEVRSDFEDTRGRAASGGAELLIADIPLFYESRSPYPADAVAVVASDRASQFARLTARPGIDDGMARAMVAAQHPIGGKLDACDLAVWNAGSLRQLQTQIQFLHQWLKTKI